MLAAFAALCCRAVAQVLEILSDRGARAVEPAGGGAGPDLRGVAGARRAATRARPRGCRARLFGGRARLDSPEQCRLITEQLGGERAVGPGGSSWASPPCPICRLGCGAAKGGGAEAAARAAARRVGERHGTLIGSATSRHLRHEPGPGRRRVAARHRRQHARLGPRIDWPAETPAALTPAVNIGPWGRDFHTPLERLHTPQRLRRLARAAAGDGAGDPSALRASGGRAAGGARTSRRKSTVRRSSKRRVVGRGHLAAAARRGQRGAAVARRLRVLPRLGRHLLEHGHAAARARPRRVCCPDWRAGRVVAGSGLKRRASRAAPLGVDDELGDEAAAATHGHVEVVDAPSARSCAQALVALAGVATPVPSTFEFHRHTSVLAATPLVVAVLDEHEEHVAAGPGRPCRGSGRGSWRGRCRWWCPTGRRG